MDAVDKKLTVLQEAVYAVDAVYPRTNKKFGIKIDGII
jgi:hypothetical protein